MLAGLVRSRFLPALAVLGLAGLAGCPDPQGSFDDFGKRYDKINNASTSSSTGGGGAPACSAPMAGAEDGDWLLGLTTQLGPTKPLAFKVTVTTTDAGGGALKLGMKATPLSAMDQMTTVGAEVDLGMFDVAPDGSFVADLGTLTVPGAANPITGADIVASVLLRGHFCAEVPTFFCGTGEGQVTMPITFTLKPEKTPFTMEKATGGVLPAPVTDCAKTPADYMGGG
jgi:hypothetical protein